MVKKFLVSYFDLHDRFVSKDDSLLILCNYFLKKVIMTLSHGVWILMLYKAFMRDSAKQFILFLSVCKKRWFTVPRGVKFVVKNFISEQRT